METNTRAYEWQMVDELTDLVGERRLLNMIAAYFSAYDMVDCLADIYDSLDVDLPEPSSICYL